MRTTPPPSGRGLQSWELGLRAINPDPPSLIPIHISRLVSYPACQGLPSSFPSLSHRSQGVTRCCNCGNWASEPSIPPRLSAIPPARASCHRSCRFPVTFGQSANATNVGKHPVHLPVPPAIQLISVHSLIPLLLPIPYPPSSTAPSPYLYTLSGDQFQLWLPKWPRSGPILLANEDRKSVV